MFTRCTITHFWQCYDYGLMKILPLQKEVS